MEAHASVHLPANEISSLCFVFLPNESDWMRIGAFLFDSQEALLTDKLDLPIRIIKEKTIEKMLKACGSCLLKNIKTGIWIAGTVKSIEVSCCYF